MLIIIIKQNQEGQGQNAPRCNEQVQGQEHFTPTVVLTPHYSQWKILTSVESQGKLFH